MKEFRRKIEGIESGAYYAASEILLIGLRHIKEHRMSHPIDTTPEQWFDQIVPELIWLLEKVAEDDRNYEQQMADKDRTERAQELLGKHFFDIWC